jgi:hypothetical protein
MPDVLIAFTLGDEEREERWPSIAAFRAWVMVNQLRVGYTAYAADDDGEWVVVEKGSLGAGAARP